MSTDISQFMISSPTAMAQELNTLIKQQDFLTVTFNQGQDSFVTLLLDVSLEQGTLIFDATSNQRLKSPVSIDCTGIVGIVGERV